MMKCLKGIIGATRDTSDDIFDNITDDQKQILETSASGLYLDELEGVVDFKVVKNASTTQTLTDFVLQAITNAEEDTENDLLLALSGNYKSRKKSFVGDIGQRTATTAVAAANRFTGVKLVPETKDGVINLSKISLFLDADSIVSVYVMRVFLDENGRTSDTGEILYTYKDIATASTKETVVFNDEKAPLVLPFEINEAPCEYWFFYQSVAGLPMNNKISCNCGSKANALAAFTTLYGVNFDDLSRLSTASRNTVYTQGFVLSTSIVCDKAQFGCRQYDQDNDVAKTLAYTVRLKAAAKLSERMLATPEINRFTLQNKEYIASLKKQFLKAYSDRLTYLVNELIDVRDSDCFVCKAKSNDIQYTKILS